MSESDSVLKKLLSKKMLFMLIHGISAGTPLLLIGSTLQALLTDYGISLAAIGMLSLAKTPYSFKPLWSPLIDRFQLGFMQRRRGYIIVFQFLLALSLAAIGQISPVATPYLFGVVCLLIGFFSASQDIVIDAYRREILTDEELGFGSTVYVTGYRVGLVFAGALALTLSESLGWPLVYLCMGGILFLCAITTLFSPLEFNQDIAPKTLKESIVGPFVDFFKRDKAILVLAFILFYKIGDQIASNMTMPLYLSLGFTKSQIGAIAKLWGMIATFAGGFLGGAIILRWGILKSLWTFGILQMVSTLGFSILTYFAESTIALTSVIAFENLSAGMGTAAYMAYMASITNKRFTATQYGLLTSLMAVPMSILAAPTGLLAQDMGWFNFYLFCTFIALPGLVLLYFMTKIKE